MLEKIKSFASKTVFFVANCLAAFLIVFLIKEAEQEQTLVTDEETNFTPVSDAVSEKQNQIAIERENRLRQLNSTPKEIKQEATTTTTTTKPEPVPPNSNSSTPAANYTPPATTKKSTSSSTTKTTTTKPKADKKTKTS